MKMYFNSAYVCDICVSFLIWTGNHEEDDGRKKQEEQEVKRLTLRKIQYKLVCDFFFRNLSGLMLKTTEWFKKIILREMMLRKWIKFCYKMKKLCVCGRDFFIFDTDQPSP